VAEFDGRFFLDVTTEDVRAIIWRKLRTKASTPLPAAFGAS
jgi:hypothetical protein